MANKKNRSQEKKKMSRRSFLKGAGITSVSVALSSQGGLLNGPELAAQEANPTVVGPGLVKIELNINGKTYPAQIETRATLAQVLRDYLHLTGTKVACDRGACGACTVILDGKIVNSCMTLALDAVGQQVETIEGLSQDGKLHILQQSFVSYDALQCGFCTPGMVMSCKNLLDHNPNPSLADVQHAVSGNLCRCGTYPKVFGAVLALCNKK